MLSISNSIIFDACETNSMYVCKLLRMEENNYSLLNDNIYFDIDDNKENIDFDNDYSEEFHAENKKTSFVQGHYNNQWIFFQFYDF